MNQLSAIIAMDWDTFLDWFKEATEKSWADLSQPPVEKSAKKNKILGPQWQKNTRWLGGFLDEEITAAEHRWSLTFPAGYRQFLATLGAPDRPMIGPGWQDGQLISVEKPAFYNWLTGTEEITAAKQWPLEGLLFDVEHNDIWLDSWGTKPDTEEETAERLTHLIQQAPPLIPLFGHRYLLDYPINGRNPVLSVYQSDIILYGTNLQTYLLREMANLINLYVEQAVSELVSDYYQKHLAHIPFWGELLLLQEGKI